MCVLYLHRRFGWWSSSLRLSAYAHNDDGGGYRPLQLCPGHGAGSLDEKR